ncbi:jg3344 [Pararge aegeria aegeria]|uniref:Jg3344 protein n=1 Tax=Pararge aegeria aegeria TaxID=348720 RepID=A0A8S4RV26_9NEOP|nr:jg3344 [Pararge aegeria aegeria]
MNNLWLIPILTRLMACDVSGAYIIEPLTRMAYVTRACRRASEWGSARKSWNPRARRSEGIVGLRAPHVRPNLGSGDDWSERVTDAINTYEAFCLFLSDPHSKGLECPPIFRLPSSPISRLGTFTSRVNRHLLGKRSSS